jgi:aquaporin Z
MRLPGCGGTIVTATPVTAPVSAKSGARPLHWPEYACEAFGLAVFMLSACAFTALMEHPMSSLHQAIQSGFLRRILMGLAMGLTALAIYYSPFGQRSGAHLNPAMTLTFFTLGKVRPLDAAGYVMAQFAGGALGVLAANMLIGPALADAAVRYAVTVPGVFGVGAAFAAEFLISFLLMIAVLVSSNDWRLEKLTPWFAACLVATWITFEAPVSGMSMNPARTVSSALQANVWTAWWICFIAPPLAMLSAGFVYRKRYGIARVYCAKIHHHNHQRCIFRCNYGAL